MDAFVFRMLRVLLAVAPTGSERNTIEATSTMELGGVVSAMLVGPLRLARALGDGAKGRMPLKTAHRALTGQHDVPATTD